MCEPVHTSFAGRTALALVHRERQRFKNLMISETHIYQSAQVLIEQYRESAYAEAMTRIERYWAADNKEEMGLWQRIADTIHMIQRPDRYAEETIH